MNIEKLFRDCDVEPFNRVVGCEFRSSKLTPIGCITKIKNLVTKDTQYILHQKLDLYKRLSLGSFFYFYAK